MILHILAPISLWRRTEGCNTPPQSDKLLIYVHFWLGILLVWCGEMLGFMSLAEPCFWFGMKLEGGRIVYLEDCVVLVHLEVSERRGLGRWLRN